MKIKVQILFSLILIFSCKQQDNRKKITKLSDFNLSTDYIEYKTRMSENDTINVFVNHSICTYQGYERIKIINKRDSLKIIDEYLEKTYDKHPEWKSAFIKTISKNDTIWNFEHFLKINERRTISDDKKHGRIQVSYKHDTIHYYSYGLIDALKFMEEYNRLMVKLYPLYLKDSFGLQ